MRRKAAVSPECARESKRSEERWKGMARKDPPADTASFMDDMNIEVIIAEDQAMVLGALAALLAAEEDIE
jgi:hypothetical protein